MIASPPRLSKATLGSLPAGIAGPAYDRAGITPGIVHLGIGAFHRAHMAAMTEAALNAGARDWGIIAASLRSPETREALAPQDGLYTLAIREAGEGGSTRESLQVIGAISRIIVAPEDPEALISAMADPAIRIVSLTVTEKGYCHDPATGALNEAHPDIIHDLADMRTPRSAPGFLLAALARRRAKGIAPFTVLCCDNLPANGETVHRVLSRMAALLETAFGDYVRTQVACPCTMVDRIVPATTDADRAHVAAELGLTDAWPVMTEGFTQWVIEDNFPQGRPNWEIAGAQSAADVAPYELMKLRMLNGAHSSLAYLGYLAGHETVADAASDPLFARYLAALWRQIMPAVPAPPGVDLAAYADSLLLRFRNPAIRHRLWQIAMDGSQKLPQRLLGTWRDNEAAGRPADLLTLAVAAWMRFASGTDCQGKPVDVRDPLSARMSELAAKAGDDPARIVDAFVGLDGVFGNDLPGNAVFRTAVTTHLDNLNRYGAVAAVDRALAAV